jgi:hypothetical protein
VESFRSNSSFIVDRMIEEIKRKSKKNDLVPENCKIIVYDHNKYSNPYWNVRFSYSVSFKDIPGGEHWFSSHSPDIYDPYEVQCVVDDLRSKLGILKEECSLFEKIKNFNWNHVAFILFVSGIIFISNEIGIQFHDEIDQIIGQLEGSR